MSSKKTSKVRAALDVAGDKSAEKWTREIMAEQRVAFRAGWNDACWNWGYRIMNWPQHLRASYRQGHDEYHYGNDN